ncbi:MAG: argininosuccinate lyase [Nitrososphaerales archaeon]|jgi:argininosuccinate lyase
MPNILRGSRVKGSSRRANDFISSIGFDGPLARHVVSISEAHMLALLRSKEVRPEVGSATLGFLAGLPADMALDPATEDVHHMVEQEAIRSIGMETAGYLNLGKSRNDQVATALRMETRDRLLDLSEALCGVQRALVGLERRYGGLPMPGYTHLQHAQPVTVAHHMQSYFEAVQRDVERARQAYGRVNLSPMGAAALAGTSVLLDRGYVASLLGFDGIAENAMDAVSSRDFALESISLCAIAMVDLSRMAEELVLWSSTEFGFAELADEYSATSSIMPQKKNPVVAETVRAKCGSVLGELAASLAITKALPNSYNLDLQEVTPHLWRALEATISSAEMMAEMLSSLRLEAERLLGSVQGDASTATELANYLVRDHGVPFRQAHAIVGEIVRASLETGSTLEEATVREMPSVSSRVTGTSIKVDKDQVRNVLDALKTLQLTRTTGGANPLFVPRLLSKDSRSLRQNLSWISDARASLEAASGRLRTQVEKNRAEVRR